MTITTKMSSLYLFKILKSFKIWCRRAHIKHYERATDRLRGPEIRGKHLLHRWSMASPHQVRSINALNFHFKMFQFLKFSFFSILPSWLYWLCTNYTVLSNTIIWYTFVHMLPPTQLPTSFFLPSLSTHFTT
jgi:hypothetical protein